jgi:hypothetical protein
MPVCASHLWPQVVTISALHRARDRDFVTTYGPYRTTASTPPSGKISDLYGRRLIFQASIVTFLVGSLLSGLAQDMTQLIE